MAKKKRRKKSDLPAMFLYRPKDFAAFVAATELLRGAVNDLRTVAAELAAIVSVKRRQSDAGKKANDTRKAQGESEKVPAGESVDHFVNRKIDEEVDAGGGVTFIRPLSADDFFQDEPPHKTLAKGQ